MTASETTDTARSALRTIRSRTLPRPGDFPQSRRGWSIDLVAGLTVGIVALPLALGFGIGAGLGAGPGLLTAIVAGIVAAIFGGSRLQVSGPTGAMTVVLVPVVADHGAAAVPLLAVIAGIIVIAAGWLGLGRAVTLVPWPVVEGFTVGIATIIFLQQIPILLDVPRSRDHDTLPATIHALQSADWNLAGPRIAIAAGVVAIMVLLRRIRPTFPGSLVAILVAAVAASMLDLDVRTIGALDLGATSFGVDVPSWSTLDELLPAAAIIAALAALESLLSARVADGMSDLAPTDPDRELVGQGLANVAAGLVGGMPATGAIARTAVNVRAGARTRAAAMFHGIVLLAVLLGASGLVAYVPYAALAGVLMLTAVRMVDVAAVGSLLRASRSDAVIFVVTAGTTIAFDLITAVEIGVAVTMVLVLRTMARASSVGPEASATLAASMQVGDDELHELLDERILVYRLDGSLFFGAAHRFVDELASLDRARVVVLRLGGLHVLDSSGAQALAETIEAFDHRGVQVVLCGMQPRHRKVLSAVGIPGRRIGDDRLATDLRDAIERAHALVA
ncbi:MAG: SulP family inorganic anion transporter [Thermoleophilia bacterium]|nr:SulP family inorganic anion transporter [Thermoleophilia bacterium]